MRADSTPSTQPLHRNGSMPWESASRVSLGEPLLSADQVASLLSIKRSTVYDLARTGQLPSLKIGRHLRFTRAMLEAALSAQHS